MTDKKITLKSLWTIVFMLLTFSLGAQDKNIISAKKAYNSKAYAKVVSMAKKALDNDKTQAEWWYLRAISEFAMSKNPKYQGGKINYEKEAIKSAVKAREYDPEGLFYEGYSEVILEIVEKNNREAMSNYAQKRYAKAIQMYKNSFDLTGDTIAFGMLGLSYWGDKKEMDALRVLKEVTLWNYGAKMEGWGEGTFIREPFVILSNYYLEKNMTDSSLYYTEMGLAVYDKNRVLIANESKILKTTLIDLARYGLNTRFRDIVKRGLFYFPNDSLFLYQQNYYYLTRIMQATQTRPFDSADQFLAEFFAEKRAEKIAGVKNASDEFLISDTAAFLFQCLDYYLRTNTPNTTPYFFKKWYVTYMKIPEYDEKLAESLLKSPPNTISKRMVGMLYSDAVAEFPWNKNFKKYRLTYFNNWMKKPRQKGELTNLLEMNEAVIADFPLDKTLKTALQANLVLIVDSTIVGGNMYNSWTYYNRLKNEFPATKELDALLKKLAVADFKKRYSETRIYYTAGKTKKVANTGWKGDPSLCQAGYLPDSTLYKVLHRTNYYRQNAGIVLPMNLSYERVQKCQEAALMFHNKSVFTREPTPETHVCFTDNAKEACQVGQGILEGNPAQCVTIFMDDAKSNELINRRSILNPEALDMGFGSVENNSIFWMLDVAGAPDSTYYQSHFVAWPPAGYYPAMLVFKKWSFSMAADLRDAKVTITDKNGQSLSYGVSLEPIPGMLLSTLIINTDLDHKKLTDKDFFNVTVELKDKRKFSYKVTLF